MFPTFLWNLSFFFWGEMLYIPIEIPFSGGLYQNRKPKNIDSAKSKTSIKSTVGFSTGNQAARCIEVHLGFVPSMAQALSENSALSCNIPCFENAEKPSFSPLRLSGYKWPSCSNTFIL
jgi:hypothetical protein